MSDTTTRLTRRSRPSRGSAYPVALPPVERFVFRALWGAAACARTLTTMASADFSPPFDDEISPGNGTLLRRTAAAFTSTGKPDDFAVLCQLVVPCRPSMRFLSIGSQLSPSLPSPGRSPFPSWLRMVVSSFSCSGIPTGDLNPVYNVPMLGTHKTWVATAEKLPRSLRSASPAPPCHHF